MSETLDKLPPEAWPLINLLFNLTMVSVAIWLAITVFVWWRRSASNLTPVNAARKNKDAQPDFLNVDNKARAEALKRGEAFDKEIERRTQQEARDIARAGGSKSSTARRVAGIVTFLMSVFSLATMVLGSIYSVSRMGSMLRNFSTQERILHVVQTYPVSFTIASLVIVYQIYRFLADRKWKES